LTYDLQYLGSVSLARDLLSGIAKTAFSPAQQEVVLVHLANPSTPATGLTQLTGASLDEIRSVYQWMQNSSTIAAVTTSPFYSRRLMYQFASETVSDWLSDPYRPKRILDGQPIVSRTVELHASLGGCQYSCTMCLWSDKQLYTYSRRGLLGQRLLNTDNWLAVLRDLQALGVTTIVFSGGGEPLLNPDLFRIMRTARELGLATHLYTSGFNLDPSDDAAVQELARAGRVRFSIHSPVADVYNQIVGMPAERNALPRVRENMAALLAARDRVGSAARIGIGFVTQPLNYHLIERMCGFAAELGVDFLNVRTDEVEVTAGLAEQQVAAVREQLTEVRDKGLSGTYGRVAIDFSDDLTALANGYHQETPRANECLAKYYRPAISPYGLVAPCDLIAEPRFAVPERVFGTMPGTALPVIMANMPAKRLTADCAQCMPSGRTGNVVYAKLLSDYQADITLAEQPFSMKVPIA
jgi:MoaA/NifB/PqqE/SkfB family radical SAM enzyme